MEIDKESCLILNWKNALIKKPIFSLLQLHLQLLPTAHKKKKHIIYAINRWNIIMRIFPRRGATDKTARGTNWWLTYLGTYSLVVVWFLAVRWVWVPWRFMRQKNNVTHKTAKLHAGVISFSTWWEATAKKILFLPAKLFVVPWDEF